MPNWKTRTHGSSRQVGKHFKSNPSRQTLPSVSWNKCTGSLAKAKWNIRVERQRKKMNLEIQDMARKMMNYYHIQKLPRIYITALSPYDSEMKLVLDSNGKTRVHSTDIILGVEHRVTMSPQTKALVWHELGHYVDMMTTPEDLERWLAYSKDKVVRMSKERRAWELARPFMKNGRSSQMWVMKEALTSYQVN